jgi:methionyl aminopeptidase
MAITIKTAADIEKLREGGKRLATIVAETVALIKPGVSTDELSDYAARRMRELNGTSAFLNYRPIGARRPFPSAICVSINDAIVHGIPDEQPVVIETGDLVTIDAGLIYDGMFTDHAITVAVGTVPKEVTKLLTATREALSSGIKMARAGNRVGDISAAIERAAHAADLTVVEGLAGHGVGYSVHEDPYVPNEGRAGTGPELKPGMVLAIEPMFCLGDGRIMLDKTDGYTYRTKDGSLSAQFEHTVLITDGEPEILTARS